MFNYISIVTILLLIAGVAFGCIMFLVIYSFLVYGTGSPLRCACLDRLVGDRRCIQPTVWALVLLSTVCFFLAAFLYREGRPEGIETTLEVPLPFDGVYPEELLDTVTVNDGITAPPVSSVSPTN